MKDTPDDMAREDNDDAAQAGLRLPARTGPGPVGETFLKYREERAPETHVSNKTCPLRDYSGGLLLRRPLEGSCDPRRTRGANHKRKITAWTPIPRETPLNVGELRSPRSRSYATTKEKIDEIALQTDADLTTTDASESERQCRTFEILAEHDPTTPATLRPREDVGGTSLDVAPEEAQPNRTRPAPVSPPDAEVEGHGRLHPMLLA